VIDAMREPKFIEGCGEQRRERIGMPRSCSSDILKFSGYAFNKSHSTGYAIVAYQTAYEDLLPRRTTWRPLLTYESVSTDKVAEYSRRVPGDGHRGRARRT
jgi:DNA polymerase III alpha subunit